jgi:phosphohistidine phosphatase
VTLYLVHHADAVGPDVDPQRPLSAAGRAHAERLSVVAAERGVKPHVIWHSGKLRARQTGEAFWRRCNPFAIFTAQRGLQPTDPPQLARDLVAGEERDLMLVGHMPNLPRLLALLARGDEDATVSFPTHGLVAVERVVEEWVERYSLR